MMFPPCRARLRQIILSYPRFAELLLATHPGQLIPAIPANSESSNGCRTIAPRFPEGCPRSRGSGQSRPNLAQFGPTLLNIWPSSANIGRVGTKYGRSGPNLAQIRPASAKLGQVRAVVGPVCPKSADFGRTRPNVEPNLGPHRVTLGQLWPDSRLLGQLSRKS